MRKLLIGLATIMPLTIGTAIAHADLGQGQGSSTPTLEVHGTIVSVNAGGGTFVANVRIHHDEGNGGGDKHGMGGGDNNGGDTNGTDNHSGGSGGSWNAVRDFRRHDRRHGDRGSGSGDTTQVTITTNSSTAITLDDATSTLANLAAGDCFEATFAESGSGSPSTALTGPALTVDARSKCHHHHHSRTLYAFVGTVTGTDTAAGTVTVTVSNSTPSGLIAPGSSATFTTDDNTLFFGGSIFGGGDEQGGSIGGITVGDVVAGGLHGDPSLTLAQVEATPLEILLDIPVGTSTGPGTTMKARRHALHDAERLLGLKKSHKHHRGHKRHH
jgi:hypothetical protein